MSTFDYDLFVIGAGSGGVRAARISARNGARVGIAEDRYLGGTCVNVGCIPKKLYVYGAHFAEDFEDAAGYGWQTDRPDFSWTTLRDNKTREIDRLGGIYRNLLEDAGVSVHWGKAVLLDPHTIQIGEQTFSARYVLVATGSWPTIPDIPGRELAITSNEAFDLDRLPEQAVVVGGGYIGVEFAGIFNGLGVATSLLYRGPLFLRGFDDDVREFMRDELVNKQLDLRFNTQITRIEATGERRRLLHLQDGTTLETDLVLYATGRHPNSQGIGLERAGVVVTEQGAIQVDDYYRTSVDNIYAIGDVIDRIQLTPVAIAEAMCIANNLFTDEPRRQLDYRNVATAVFCQPNIGTVGLTEQQAREEFGAVTVYRSTFRPLKHTLSGRAEKSLMKLIVDPVSDRVVGAHMVGSEAGEIIQGLAIALQAGLTKAQFDATIGIHPTAAEEFVTMREPVS